MRHVRERPALCISCCVDTVFWAKCDWRIFPRAWRRRERARGGERAKQGINAGAHKQGKMYVSVHALGLVRERERATEKKRRIF